jgi:hypothetical protein
MSFGIVNGLLRRNPDWSTAFKRNPAAPKAAIASTPNQIQGQDVFVGQLAQGPKTREELVNLYADVNGDIRAYTRDALAHGATGDPAKLDEGHGKLVGDLREKINDLAAKLDASGEKAALEKFRTNTETELAKIERIKARLARHAHKFQDSMRTYDEAKAIAEKITERMAPPVEPVQKPYPDEPVQLGDMAQFLQQQIAFDAVCEQIDEENAHASAEYQQRLDEYERTSAEAGSAAEYRKREWSKAEPKLRDEKEAAEDTFKATHDEYSAAHDKAEAAIAEHARMLLAELKAKLPPEPPRKFWQPWPRKSWEPQGWDGHSTKKFSEADHPRGQPQNAGQFASGFGGSKPAETEKPKPSASKPSGHKPAQKPPAKPSPLKEAAALAVSKIKPAKKPAFSGTPTDASTKISKQLAGAIGEEIVIKYLQSKGFADAGHLADFVGSERNNLPVDLVHDHRVVEVKTGQSSNSASAQQWRLTIGEPGPKEKEMLANMSDEDKSAWNAQKQADIHKRKDEEIAKLSKELGYKIKSSTMTVILDPKTKTADLYEFDGFHDRIGWTSDTAKKGFIGSFSYG